MALKPCTLEWKPMGQILLCPWREMEMHTFTITDAARHLLPYTFDNHCRMSQWFHFGQRLQKKTNYTAMASQ